MLSKPSKSMYLNVDIDKAQKIENPLWKEVSGIPAFFLGWGSVPQQNLAYRKRMGMPGAPFGGMGWLDPQKIVSEVAAPEVGAPPADLTAERVIQLKIKHFDLCASGASEQSMYLWTLQLIYDTKDRAVSAEILIRVRNGSDSAPFEDVVALMNPEQEEDMRKVYAKWKAAEIVDFTLHALKTYPVLQKLANIYSNVRPLDMPTDTLVFKELVSKMEKLTAEDLELLKEKVIVEVTEDQKHPEHFEQILKAWKALGFKLSYDDAIGSKASDKLQKKAEEVTFHTPEALAPLINYFDFIKIDIEWAGKAIFLSHPSYSSRAEKKAQVLEHVKNEGTVLIPKGPEMADSGLSHDEACAELADMCKVVMDAGKKICIELTVRADDANNAYSIQKLKGMGVDIFGEHQDSFLIQGGLTGAKAFTPEALAACVRMDSEAIASPALADGKTASASAEKPSTEEAATTLPEGKAPVASAKKQTAEEAATAVAARPKGKAAAASAKKQTGEAATALPEGKASAASAEQQTTDEAAIAPIEGKANPLSSEKFFDKFEPM